MGKQPAEAQFLPLSDVAVLVPRAAAQAGGMKRHLESLGASVLCVPTIAFTPPSDPRPMRDALSRLSDGGFAWTVFTSTNAVDAFFAVAGTPEVGLSALARSRVAAVGAKTAKELASRGVDVELTPAATEQNAAGLVKAFPLYDAGSGHPPAVFLPRADIATNVLPAGLAAAGWEPDDVVAYRTVCAPPPSEEIRRRITDGGVDAICFTSGSTVRNLLEMAGPPAPNTVIACIGPMAAAQAQEKGLEVHVMPEHASARDLVEALAEYYSR